MKKTIFILALTVTVVAGTIFTSCKSSVQKQAAAQDTVQDARKDLKAAQVVATAAEWEAFRTEAELKIRNNEIRITELNAKMKRPGEIFDELYAKKIANLEQQNKDMRARLLAYEKSQTNWESFKREFNHDMDAIAQAFKDLSVDNKK